ncbi:UNKNOWN [Stylonychia lemnae]|uniref:VIT domain-containing protein n=1 Tax=Stylonychia lemnae TaxID=5949 RepID=A0A078AXB6_STYLE|nr:UNKNOWN [Stylonychia lemnae]|eukprot:CDW87105.1 UNKNOWN [Stylonychia lemnae]
MPFMGCCCGFYYGRWNRFNFMIKDRDQTMHFKSQSIDVQVNDMIAIINISQVFLNELQESVEATYEFPTDPDVVVSRLVIQMDDRVIEGKIMEKEKAQEKYDDAIAGGNAAVLVKEKDLNKDLLQMTIGGINTQQEVKVNVQMIKHLEIEAGAYCLRIPTSYFIKSYNDVKLVQDFTSNKDKFSTKYSFTINVETSKSITYLSVPNHSDVVKNLTSS